MAKRKQKKCPRGCIPASALPAMCQILAAAEATDKKEEAEIVAGKRWAFPMTRGAVSGPSGDSFPSGAKVYIDGRDLAIVRQAFPTGSTSLLFPHYKVDFVDGDKNVAVPWNRVGIVPSSNRSTEDVEWFVVDTRSGVTKYRWFHTRAEAERWNRENNAGFVQHASSLGDVEYSLPDLE